VQSQLESQGLGLELTPEAKLLLAQKGYDPQLGARPLRRTSPSAFSTSRKPRARRCSAFRSTPAPVPHSKYRKRSATRPSRRGGTRAC
jgi:hypothetical protein